jgi:hypothetical protein
MVHERDHHHTKNDDVSERLSGGAHNTVGQKTRNKGHTQALMDTHPDGSVRRNKADNLHVLAAPRPGASGSINNNVSPVRPLQMRKSSTSRLLHSADDSDLLVDVLCGGNIPQVEKGASENNYFATKEGKNLKGSQQDLLVLAPVTEAGC